MSRTLIAPASFRDIQILKNKPKKRKHSFEYSTPSDTKNGVQFLEEFFYATTLFFPRPIREFRRTFAYKPEE
jgi:hypothetical protein